MKKWLGFERRFDFSHQHSFQGKCENWGLAFVANLFWTITMGSFLLFLWGMNKDQLVGIVMTPIGWKLYADLFPATLSVFYGKIALFVSSCVIAPLGEEYVFRKYPNDNAFAKNPTPQLKFLLTTWIASSILFGVAHGSIWNLFFQGVAGFIFSWLYTKNNCSYWSAVSIHAAWNFFVIFGVRVFLLP